MNLSAAAWGALAYLTYGRIAFGTWSIGGVYDTFMEGRISQLSPSVYGWRLAGTLISPARGALLHTPLLLAAFAPTGWTRSPDWVRALAVGGMVYVAAGRILEGFSGGPEQETYRYALEAVVLVLLVVVPWLLEVGRRWVVGLLVAISVGVQAAAAVFDGPYPDHTADPGFGLGDWAYVPAAIWTIAGLAGVAAGGLTIAIWNRGAPPKPPSHAG